MAPARHCLQPWSSRYNTNHPHSALGVISPQAYRKHYSPEAG
ncbi:hypothetical protein J7S19_11935 [Corynebacterium pyruviciproducens]|nr:hypothetical protein [Corynebacterium pyruviciproducens]